eukprot:TRINITY_DN7404_c0_g2_i1.p1 TRINITY_DN7404_c0_g2~~TRINITY_DN7404_c0_g2_i1.p1  ORF type:complete len:1346 (-),score=94.71 TRINITY_DN7404_c0_g2_i1:137-4174(-)
MKLVVHLLVPLVLAVSQLLARRLPDSENRDALLQATWNGLPETWPLQPPSKQQPVASTPAASALETAAEQQTWMQRGRLEQSQCSCCKGWQRAETTTCNFTHGQYCVSNGYVCPHHYPQRLQTMHECSIALEVLARAAGQAHLMQGQHDRLNPRGCWLERTLEFRELRGFWNPVEGALNSCDPLPRRHSICTTKGIGSSFLAVEQSGRALMSEHLDARRGAFLQDSKGALVAKRSQQDASVRNDRAQSRSRGKLRRRAAKRKTRSRKHRSVSKSINDKEIVAYSRVLPSDSTNVEKAAEGGRCTCMNGVAANVRDCALGMSFCSSCHSGYSLVGTSCQPNLCLCKGGYAAVGEKCTGFGMYACQSCYQGYDLVDGTCKELQCFCPHGTSPQGGACKDVNQISCISCDQGYHLDAGTCQPNTCKCINGIPDYGDGCITPDSISCSSCEPGYSLISGECWLENGNGRNDGQALVDKGLESKDEAEQDMRMKATLKTSFLEASIAMPAIHANSNATNTRSSELSEQHGAALHWNVTYAKTSSQNGADVEKRAHNGRGATLLDLNGSSVSGGSGTAKSESFTATWNITSSSVLTSATRLNDSLAISLSNSTSGQSANGLAISHAAESTNLSAHVLQTGNALSNGRASEVPSGVGPALVTANMTHYPSASLIAAQATDVTGAISSSSDAIVQKDAGGSDPSSRTAVTTFVDPVLNVSFASLNVTGHVSPMNDAGAYDKANGSYSPLRVDSSNTSDASQRFPAISSTQGGYSTYTAPSVDLAAAVDAPSTPSATNTQTAPSMSSASSAFGVQESASSFSGVQDLTAGNQSLERLDDKGEVYPSNASAKLPVMPASDTLNDASRPSTADILAGDGSHSPSHASATPVPASADVFNEGLASSVKPLPDNIVYDKWYVSAVKIEANASSSDPANHSQPSIKPMVASGNDSPEDVKHHVDAPGAGESIAETEDTSSAKTENSETKGAALQSSSAVSSLEKSEAITSEATVHPAAQDLQSTSPAISSEKVVDVALPAAQTLLSSAAAFPPEKVIDVKPNESMVLPAAQAFAAASFQYQPQTLAGLNVVMVPTAVSSGLPGVPQFASVPAAGRYAFPSQIVSIAAPGQFAPFPLQVPQQMAFAPQVVSLPTAQQFAPFAPLAPQRLGAVPQASSFPQQLQSPTNIATVPATQQPLMTVPNGSLPVTNLATSGQLSQGSSVLSVSPPAPVPKAVAEVSKPAKRAVPRVSPLPRNDHPRPQGDELYVAPGDDEAIPSLSSMLSVSVTNANGSLPSGQSSPEDQAPLSPQSSPQSAAVPSDTHSTRTSSLAEIETDFSSAIVIGIGEEELTNVDCPCIVA